MASGNDWETMSSERSRLFGTAGMGILRVTLLFGSAGVALALILAPVAENYTKPQFARLGNGGIDFSTTGSIGPRNIYTVRRSVLQPSPDSICIIRNGGLRTGDC